MDIFIVTFRETLEAAIIIGLIFSMLRVFGVTSHRKRYIIAGIILGIVMSFIFAYLFSVLAGGFSGAKEKIYEGVLMLLACAMITQFLIWTNSNFQNVGKKLNTTLKYIVTTKQLWMLSLLAFASVVREGIETVIFLKALEFSVASTDIYWAVFGVVGAIGISYFLFFAITKINIKKVLSYTNVLFVLIAAGLLAHGIVELQGANILPTYIKPLFDLSGILPESSGFGAILKASFSYDANPSLLAMLGYVAYIGIIVGYFWRRKKSI